MICELHLFFILRFQRSRDSETDLPNMTLNNNSCEGMVMLKFALQLTGRDCFH